MPTNKVLAARQHSEGSERVYHLQQQTRRHSIEVFESVITAITPITAAHSRQRKSEEAGRVNIFQAPANLGIRQLLTLPMNQSPGMQNYAQQSYNSKHSANIPTVITIETAKASARSPSTNPLETSTMLRRWKEALANTTDGDVQSRKTCAAG